MQTMQTQLTKYRNFLAKERFMQQPNIETPTNRQLRPTARNTRYKRSSDEVDKDMDAVNKLISQGTHTQIEALKEVGLQSSVYHYRMRQDRKKPLTTRKPRKYSKKELEQQEFVERKQNLFKELKKEVPNNNDLDLAKQTIKQLEMKVLKLKSFIVDSLILDDKLS